MDSITDATGIAGALCTFVAIVVGVVGLWSLNPYLITAFVVSTALAACFALVSFVSAFTARSSKDGPTE